MMLLLVRFPLQCFQCGTISDKTCNYFKSDPMLMQISLGPLESIKVPQFKRFLP